LSYENLRRLFWSEKCIGLSLLKAHTANIRPRGIIVGLLVRLLLFVAGAIAGWFVAKDAINFISVQITAALLLFLAFAALLAFWPTEWIKKLYVRLTPWSSPRHGLRGNTSGRRE